MIMANTSDEGLLKKIKKNIYGKPQTIKVTFPAGLGAIALLEIKSILGSLWFAKHLSSDCSLLKNEIIIENIHMVAIMELLMRNQCFSDIRLVVFRGRTIEKHVFEKKCREIDWEFYLNKNMSLKLKINSVASKAFHETGLKKILADSVKNYVSEIVSGENSIATTCIYADLYKNKLTLSISLAGEPLYKRGYRGELSASAPLKEDAAACCIQSALKFALTLKNDFLPNTVIIPFSGTGTFAFEMIQFYFKISPVLFEREYALQKMSFYGKESFNFLVKKAGENCLLNKELTNEFRICCIDNSKNANIALFENITHFKKSIAKYNINIQDELFVHDSKNHQPFFAEDFLTMDITKIISHKSKRFGNIFIPLNPPYGIRLNRSADSVDLYKNIARKINEISGFTKREQKNVCGFILCPNEETWSAFVRQLHYLKIETYHFTQGGLDIRVCQFFA